MSLQSLLSIARSALLTQQRAMRVTAQNVANAETPGYTRQRLRIQAVDPDVGTFGTIGRGVTDLGVTRMRSRFYDDAFRRDSGLFGGSDTLQSYLAEIENALGGASEHGLATALDEMFQSFSDLANDPSSPAIRDLVRASADRFVHLMHRTAADIDAARANALEQLQSDVGEVNDIAERIADLNARILAAGGPDHSAADLEDRRDLLVDQLSSLIGVRVTIRDDGALTVAAGNTVLVDGGTARRLEVRVPADLPVAIGVAGTPTEIAPLAGSLTALLGLVNDRIPMLRSQLDAMAGALVFEVNRVHRGGFNAYGAAGTDFFNPIGVTASTIGITGAIQSSSSNIAAGATPAVGDGNVALQIAALADAALSTLGGRSLRDYYAGLVGGVASDYRNAALDVDAYDALLAHDESQRQSVSGVSVEEEMVLLIGQQQAYSAAARIVRVADEMMRDVLQML